MPYTALSDDIPTLSQFTRRKAITITTSGTSIPIGYQVKLTITYEPEMQASFDDIRFNTRSGLYVDYWIETYIASTTAIVWIELSDAITDPGSDTIYMYYGNDGLSDGGDGDDVFEFFDDFAIDSIGTKWIVDDAPVSISDGILILNPSGEQAIIRTKDFSSDNYIIDMKWKFSTLTSLSRDGILARYQNVSNFYDVWITNSSFTNLEKGMICGKRVDGSWTESDNYSNFDFSEGIWYNIKFVVNGNNLKGYFEDELKSSQTYTDYANGKVGVRSFFNTVHVDDFRVRKYTTNEPISSYGTVQHQRRIPQFIG